MAGKQAHIAAERAPLAAPDMSASLAHVFISYSRKDYYFAESLAFHLLKHGVAAWLDVKDLTPGVDWERDLTRAVDDASTVLLVASPAAMGSPNVRQEWQRALSQGKRIVVLHWFRRTRLPAELQHCEAVDFRGRFGAALSRLLSRLDAAAPQPGAAAGRPGFMPRWPPAILATLAALAMPIVGYALVTAPQLRLDDAEMASWGLGPLGQGAVLLAFAFGLVWALCLSLVQRRMGMTRLVVCLAFVAMPYVLALAKLHLSGPGGLTGMDPGTVQTVTAHWRIGLVFLAFPLAGIALVMLARPGDLLRWMPTGKVWPAYRNALAAHAGTELVDARRAFARLGAYRLVHDAADGPAAARLRAELAQAGATAAAPNDGEATTVLLITNNTGVGWLVQQSEALANRPLLVVVGSAIATPETLAWLWKRQWVDFRRWDLQRPAKERGLPAVPEAVGSPQLPASVARTHRLLCAFGAMLFAVGGTLQPKQSAQTDILSAAEAIGMAAAICGLLLAVPARGLLRRSMPLRTIARWLVPLVPAGTLLGLASLGWLSALPGAWWRALLGATGLVVLLACLWRRRADLAFWFPQGPGAAALRLEPGRDWRTFVTFAIFALLWMLLLDPTALD
ncbi:toll/interleukin-1 receptor domain-containing protein [Piscinibacter sp.]|uniref:toll/interleukin-1 receptor domain-containing protein n=1 Tax=Piscinibacter sp. TaxID=1903157 RepID=UPI002F3F711C